MGRSIEQAIQTEDGWDGYGAGPTSEKAIEVANQAFWVPTVNDGLQWEIHAGGWDIEVEIYDDGRIEFYAANKERKVEFYSED